MKPEIVELPEDILEINKVQFFFEDFTNILQVSISGVVDFEIVDSYIKKLEKKPNLYGILTKQKDNDEWKLRYIGQRKSTNIRQRLKEHLIRKHPKTGSKLDKVNNELAKGNQIGIKLITIIPDELRLYYEGKLLSCLSDLDWNIHK